MQTDPNGLRQVLLNVILNAVDASPAGNAVVLQIFRPEREKSIVIQIDDSGQGWADAIPMNYSSPLSRPNRAARDWLVRGRARLWKGSAGALP